MPTDPIAETMRRGVSEGVFPGGVLLVRHRGRVVHHAAYGNACLIPVPEPASCATIYDLASLTKPLATVTTVVHLLASGRIKLDDSVERLIPDVEGELRKCTVRHLLNHCSALPAWRPFYEKVVPDGKRLRDVPLSQRRRAMFELIHREPLLEPLGARSVYSDLGFILLGEILERATGRDWLALCKEVFSALGIQGLFYMTEQGRSDGIASKSEAFAATEQDQWRGRVLRGEVHDENAAVMGGVSSHAGLFGTVEAVASLAAPWLSAVRGEAGLLSTSIAREFVARQNLAAESSWGLGWDTPSSGPTGPSSSGRYLSPASFGHLGYAGTSLWMDPEQDLMAVLLTNRVHPTRKNNLIRQFRPALHDAVFKAVIGRD